MGDYDDTDDSPLNSLVERAEEIGHMPAEQAEQAIQTYGEQGSTSELQDALNAEFSVETSLGEVGFPAEVLAECGEYDLDDAQIRRGLTVWANIARREPEFLDHLQQLGASDELGAIFAHVCKCGAPSAINPYAFFTVLRRDYGLGNLLDQIDQHYDDDDILRVLRAARG